MHTSGVIYETLILYGYAGVHTFQLQRIEFSIGGVATPAIERDTLSIAYVPYLRKYFISEHSCGSLLKAFEALKNERLSQGFCIENGPSVSAQGQGVDGSFQAKKGWTRNRTQAYTKANLLRELLCIEMYL